MSKCCSFPGFLPRQNDKSYGFLLAHAPEYTNQFLLGYRLNTTLWMMKNVSSKVECVIECVNEPCCRSINYKKNSHNEANCEMLSDVVYNTSDPEKVLVKNCSYDYVYLTNPQKVCYSCLECFNWIHHLIPSNKRSQSSPLAPITFFLRPCKKWLKL